MLLVKWRERGLELHIEAKVNHTNSCVYVPVRVSVCVRVCVRTYESVCVCVCGEDSSRLAIKFM